jgi:hypothetical protein
MFYFCGLYFILIIPVVYRWGQLKHLVSLLLLHMGFAVRFPLQAVHYPSHWLYLYVGYPDYPCCVPAGPAEAPGEPAPPPHGIRCLLLSSGSPSALLIGWIRYLSPSVSLLLLHMGFTACFPLQAVTLPLSFVVPVGYPDNPCCVPAGPAEAPGEPAPPPHGICRLLPLQAVTLPFSLVVPVSYPDNPCCVPAGPAEAPSEPASPPHGIRCLLSPSGIHSTLLSGCTCRLS